MKKKTFLNLTLEIILSNQRECLELNIYYCCYENKSGIYIKSEWKYYMRKNKRVTDLTSISGFLNFTGGVAITRR